MGQAHFRTSAEEFAFPVQFHTLHSMEDPVVLLMVILRHNYRGGGNLKKFYWNTVGKSFFLELLCQPSERTFLICASGRIKLAGRTENIKADLENSDERR